MLERQHNYYSTKRGVATLLYHTPAVTVSLTLATTSDYVL